MRFAIAALFLLPLAKAQLKPDDCPIPRTRRRRSPLGHALPTEISADKALWKTAIPPGHSRDSRWLPHLPHRRRRRVARHHLPRPRDRQVLWRRDAPRPRKGGLSENELTRFATPASDGQSAFVFFGDYGMLAYGLDGDTRWSLPLGPSTTRTVTGPRRSSWRLGGSDLATRTRTRI